MAVRRYCPAQSDFFGAIGGRYADGEVSEACKCLARNLYMESDVVVIPVDAHLITLTISTPEIVMRPVRVGRETRMQRERIQRTREIPTQRSAASLILSFIEVNKIFGAADIRVPAAENHTRICRGAEGIRSA